MSRSFTDGIAIGSAALVFIGLSSLLFTPKNSNLALATGILAGVGTAIALKQEKQQLKQRLHQLEQKLHAIDSQVNLKQTPNSIPAPPEPKILLKPPGNETKTNLNEQKLYDEGSLLNLATVEVEQAIAWLKTRGISVENHSQYNLDADPIFNKIALHLGKHYSNLAELYHELKKSANSGRASRVDLQNKTQTDVSNFTNFCTMLEQSSLLSEYKYFRAEKMIRANVQNRGDIKNFFTGFWFERYIYQTVSQIVIDKNLVHTCLINPQIQFANGNRFELDLLFLIEGQPLWIECKTGKEYNAHLQKYSQHRNALGIPKERSLLVILDIPETQTIDLTKLWNMTVVNEYNFAQAIKDVL